MVYQPTYNWAPSCVFSHIFPQIWCPMENKAALRSVLSILEHSIRATLLLIIGDSWGVNFINL